MGTYQADDSARAAIQAIYIYNFTTMADWPAESKQGNFVIGVYGTSKIYTELIKKYASKSIGKQPIEIKKIKSSSEAPGCHILVLAKSNNSKAGEVTQAIGTKNTMLIAEGNGMLDKGAIINFVFKDAYQRFEISKKNAKKHSISIGSDLINLSINKGE